MNDAPQRSPEWFAARVGCLSASVIGKALLRLKRGERAQTGMDLMYELAAERLTGAPAKRVNALTWGVEHEDEAREAYAFLTNAKIEQVGFITHPTIANAGCSPDALVGAEGGLEIKCPTSGTHLRTLLEDAVPEEHLPQILWGLAATGRQWWDFVSFDPRFPSELQFFVKRVMRDEAAIEAIENEARAFLAELEGKLEQLRERYP